MDHSDHHTPNGRNGSTNGYSGPSNFYKRSFQYDESASKRAAAMNGDDIDLSHLFNLVLQNKWKLLLSIIVCTAAATFYVMQQPNIYQSEGTLFISENKSGMGSSGSDLQNLLASSYGIGAGSTINNELQIIRSRTLSEHLADSILARALSVNDSNTDYPLIWAEDEDGEPVLASKSKIADRIRGRLSAAQVERDAELVKVSFNSTSPEEATKVVNLAMDIYSDMSTEQNRTMANSAIRFLEGEREKIENELEQTEQELQEFMDKTTLVAVDSQTQGLIETLSELESKRQEIRVQLVAVNSAISNYEQQLEEIRPGLAEQFSESLAPTIERYQLSLAELETEKLLLLRNNPELADNGSNPEINLLNQRIARTKEEIRKIADRLINSNSSLSLTFMGSEGSNITSRIIEINQKLIELRVEQSSYETQQEVLSDRITQLNTQFDGLPTEIIQLARLKRDVKINEELYLLVSNQYAEMSLWERTQFGNGSPLDYAVVPTIPIGPNKKRWVLIGFMLGCVVGLGFVYVRDAFDNKIKSPEDLKSLALPFLGSIPDFKIVEGFKKDNNYHVVQDKMVSNQLVTLLDHISPVAEAYRRLRINILYANPDKNYKVLMVSSSNKGEGKSTIVANLAVSLSESERTVCILDLDLRRPTQHKVFGENREPGLLELLFDTHGMKACVRKTVAQNVDLITVGKDSPEPARVLDSKRLRSVINILKEKYDHVILDTAPYGIISDSASLVRLIDGVVIVTQFDQTTDKELEFTLEGLRHVNAEIVGTVLNGFDPRKSSDYYSNYQYYKRTYEAYNDYVADSKKTGDR
ncbi:GumC family protein [Balneola sp. MJW-20]|uniref:GumC family protein n=1 Tax=Gracilimonas aurantiaca TaxID=3234185 RepID=UPI003466A6F0